MIAGNCYICEAPTVMTCQLCGMPVCAVHYDARKRLCSKCASGGGRSCTAV